MTITDESWELVLHELVIPDMKQADATGKFDRNVLFWLQDAYLSRAVKENMGEMLNLHRDLSRAEMSEEERWKCRTEFLAKVTKEVYCRVKSEGDGFDLKQYVDAAKTFYESKSVLHAGRLGELAEYIEKSMEAGVTPNVERFACEAYVDLARMSDVIVNLEGVGVRAGAQLVVRVMEECIERISQVAVTQFGESLYFGKDLLKVVDLIAQAPDRYMRLVDSSKLDALKNAGLWGFEFVSRGQSESVPCLV